ncbi:gamma carbonic anhydrase family protein [Kordiimonas sediminis]|uniref:Gamma carbonic anhydrase family protein n=1 Tax=Kordiimonas sediminis TaxID=1735581 RepID=A0A919AW45_9PROT|nr:gamma carbonic anhydrase family protein [Kordiimonas sediminis]GHF26577.1 gamma carbonic anhydrase family protein [Kordiimonas sediminis]
MIYRIDGISPTIDDDSVWIADNAAVVGNVRLKKKSSVWFGVTIRGDNDPMVIGERTNIQDGSVLHSDVGYPLNIGDGVTVGHKVMLHGCTIGDNSLIGMGATILNGAKIGKNSIVGANSLVTEGKEFPDGVLIVGSPARVVRELSQEQISMIEESAEIYEKNSERFTSGLEKVNY